MCSKFQSNSMNLTLFSAFYQLVSGRVYKIAMIASLVLTDDKAPLAEESFPPLAGSDSNLYFQNSGKLSNLRFPQTDQSACNLGRHGAA